MSERAGECAGGAPGGVLFGGVAIDAAGERVVLLPERAAWWPGVRTLLVADLHLGKADAMRAHGAAVPTATNHESLTRLARLVERHAAARVMVLGDLLHAPLGITEDLVESVAVWRAGVDVELVLVPGNHDRKVERVAERWGMRVTAGVVREGVFEFVHDDAARAHAEQASFVWSGHVHPVARVRAPGGMLRPACFVVGGRGCVLPAFSLFTGGAPVCAHGGERLYACADDVVIELPPEPAKRSRTRATNSR